MSSSFDGDAISRVYREAQSPVIFGVPFGGKTSLFVLDHSCRSVRAMTHHLMSSWPVAVQSGERGRSAVLTAPVEAGDLVSSCPCYAVAVDPEWLESVCVGCASLSKTPLSLRCEVCPRGDV